MKIDVQGYDLEALTEQTILKHKTIIFETKINLQINSITHLMILRNLLKR